MESYSARYRIVTLECGCIEMFVTRCDYRWWRLEGNVAGTLRMKSIGGHLRERKLVTDSKRRGEISWAVERLSASQDGLYCME
jgi:hypothetical protein